MKKTFRLSFVALLSALLLTCTLSVNGEFVPASNTIKEYTPITETDLSGIATLYQSTITTYNRRQVGDASKLANHVTSWVEPNVSIKDSDIRVVSYSAGSSTHWQGKKPTQLAQIYEREHPGWKVIAGINNDFFHINENSEVLGTLMQEGDFYKPWNYIDGQGHAALGFFDDGTYIYGTAPASSNEYVQVKLEDGTYQNLVQVDSVDGNISESGVSLFSRYKVCTMPYKTLNIENEPLPFNFKDYKVYTVTYQTQRLDRNTRKVFVKGVITSIDTNTETFYINDTDNKSYLVCKNGQLDSINLGDEVRVQCTLSGEWEKVTNIAGSYNVVLSNSGVVDYSEITAVNTGYINPSKNRTVMGFKEDGTPIIMVIEKHHPNGFGSSYEECGEILKSLGCVNGYLFDGGGSACIFVKNQQGNFVTINKQEDGNERSDGNAILLVMRDPGFSINATEVNRFDAKIELNPTITETYSQLTNIKVTVNGVTKDYVDGGVIFTNLEEEVTYPVKVTAKIPAYNGEGVVDTSLTSSFTTKGFVYPQVGFTFENIGKNSFEVKRNINLPRADEIINVMVKVGSKSYSMGSNESLVIDNLLMSTPYNVVISYEVNDTDSGRKYAVENEPVEVSTTSYNVPVINSFREIKKTDSSVTFSYDYTDTDRVVKDAYILYNGEKVEIIGKNGDQRITKLNFKENDYSFKLVLEVTTPENDQLTITSASLDYNKPQEVITPTISLFEAVKQDNKVLVKYNINDPSEAIESISLAVNGKLRVLETTEVEITDIDLVNNDNKFVLVVSYINTNGDVQEIRSSEVLIEKSKKEFVLPVITNFTAVKDNNKIVINYIITDKDSIATEAFVVINGTSVNSISLTENNLIITDIDFSNDVKVKIVLEYDNGEKNTISSQEITLLKNETPKKKCGKKTISIVLSLITTTTILAFMFKKKH